MALPAPLLVGRSVIIMDSLIPLLLLLFYRLVAIQDILNSWQIKLGMVKLVPYALLADILALSASVQLY